MSLLLSPSGRGGQLQWQAAGFARVREAFLLLSFELLKSHPGFPRLEQQGSCLHACCRFARVLAEARLGLGTGGCMDAACTGGLWSLFQPSHGCQGPTKVHSALTLARHIPTAPHSGVPPSGPYAAAAMLSPPRHCRAWPGRCRGRQVKQPLCISSPTTTSLPSARLCCLIYLPGTSVPYMVVTSGGSGWAVLMPALQRRTWLCVRGGHSRAFVSSISFRSPIGTRAWLFLAIPLSIPL